MKPSNQALTTTENEVIRESIPSLMTQPAPIWIDAGHASRGPGMASLLEIPFMNKRLILICTLLGVLLGWVAILVWPRSYQSEAKLMMRVGRESVSLDPTATTASTLMLQKTQEEEIVSALEVLNSREVAETVVDKLGAENVLLGRLPDDPTQVAGGTADGTVEHYVSVVKDWGRSVGDSLHGFLLRAGIKDDISDRELAVRRLSSSLSIESPRRSTVLVVEGRSKTPAMAQAIVKEVIDSFESEHLDGAYTVGSLAFFRRQSAEVQEQLDALVKERAEFMQEHQIVSIEANKILLREQLSGISRDLVTAYGDLEKVVAEAEDLVEKEAAAENDIIANRLEASDSTWSGMRQRIYELELQEQQALSKYTDKHPHLQRIRMQLEGARAILEELKSERVDLSTTPNPVKIRLGEELQKQQTAIVGLESAISEKETRQAEMRREVEELLECERHLTQLDREIRMKENHLANLREKQEEARVIDGLHDEKISNINLFQPATFVERPVSPQKKLLAAGFLLLGLTTGLGLSFLRQATSSTLRTSDDVESELGCRVVANIPQISRMASPRLKDKKLYRQKCQALIAEILLCQRKPRQSRGRSLGVISVDAGSGASTLAMNLAVTANVDCHMKTVLVDADSRRRSISRMLGLNGAPGLVELVSGNASHDECLQKVKDSPIDLIASAADSCEEILTSSPAEIVQALQAYLHDSDLLVVDLPAASEPDQAIALAQHLDLVLVVAESERTKSSAAERLLRRLSQSDTEIVGVVLTKSRSYIPKVLRRFVATPS